MHGPSFWLADGGYVGDGGLFSPPLLQGQSDRLCPSTGGFPSWYGGYATYVTEVLKNLVVASVLIEPRPGSKAYFDGWHAVVES